MTKALIHGFAGAAGIFALVMIVAVIVNIGMQALGFHGIFN